MNPLSIAALPFAPPSPWTGKRVFAHYFPTFPLSIDNLPASSDYYNAQYLTPTGESGKHVAYGGYLRQRPLPVPPGPAALNWKQFNMQTEVQMAIARGITGFCFDVLSLADGLAGGRLPTLMAAAAAVDGRFRVMPMLDMVSLGQALTPGQAAQVIAAADASPAVLRHADGRLIFSAYNAPAQSLTWWQAMIGLLNAEGVYVAFLPVLPSSGQTPGTLAPASYGCGGWGTATPAASAGLSAAAAHAGGFVYMLPVGAQQCRPKSSIYWEAGNTGAFRASWAAAIATDADFIQCVTWSDFSESSQVAPCTDAMLNPSIGTGFYDLTAYYASWFATGVQPVITQDVLYWCHRRHPAAAAHPKQVDAMTVVTAGGTPAVDLIEVVAFLTQAATVVVNGVATACPRGINVVTAPLTPGVPTYAVQRNGSNVFAGMGPMQIYGVQGLPSGLLDLSYWSGSFTQAGRTAYSF